MIIWASQRTGSSRLMEWLYPYHKFDLEEKLPVPFPNLDLFNPGIGACRGLDVKKVLEQKVLAKVHPDVIEWDIIREIVSHSKNHKHVILYRKNTYERLLSQAWKENFSGDINLYIQNELEARKKYLYVVDNLNPDIISYEDLYIKKDRNLLLKIFPELDPDVLLQTERYPNHKNYKEIEELRKAVSQLPEFNL